MNCVKLSAWNLRLDNGEIAGEWVRGFQEEARADLLRTAANAAVAGAFATRLDLDRRLSLQVANAIGGFVVSLRGRAERNDPRDCAKVNDFFAWTFTGGREAFQRSADLVTVLSVAPTGWNDLDPAIIKEATPEIIRYSAFYAEDELRWAVLNGARAPAIEIPVAESMQAGLRAWLHLLILELLGGVEEAVALTKELADREALPYLVFASADDCRRAIARLHFCLSHLMERRATSLN